MAFTECSTGRWLKTTTLGGHGEMTFTVPNPFFLIP